MPDKKQILKSISALAKRLGHPPSRAEFTSQSGISAFFVLHWFRSWSDAVRAAGLQPYTRNARIDDRTLLEDWGKTIQRKRAILPRHIYLLEGKYNPCTFANRFGGWTRVPEAFRNFAKGKREWADVLALLPPPEANEHSLQLKRNYQRARCARQPSPGKAQHAAFKNRATYGDAIHFPAFRNEPVNEQGVVLLFGMLAKDLGYIIEAAQKEFPDCEARREIAPGRWQRVSIEFEYESKNFHQHGHPVNGCDVIVCWRHNWEQCPKHIEILELCSVINSLVSPGG